MSKFSVEEYLDPLLVPFQAVMEMHGGTMGGHTIGGALIHYIELPISVTAVRSAADTRVLLPPILSSVTSRRVRVLVVDDSSLCRKMLTQRLQLSNFLCDEAVTGSAAVIAVLQAAETGLVYDGILMDNTMPVMSGVTSTAMIRLAGYKGKVFAVTGNVLDDDKTAFRSSGADRVFEKPLSTSDYDYIISGEYLDRQPS